MRPIHSSSDRGTHAALGWLEGQAGHRFPLKAVAVRVSVDGTLAETRLRQTFHNATAEPIEATYIHPLSDRAAVRSFRMISDSGVVEARLRERGEARQEYRDGVEAGHRAALQEEDRSGVFTVSVGTLAPGEQVAVELSLVEELECSGGKATLRIPLTIGPRPVAGKPLDRPPVGSGTSWDTEEVPDASRVTPPLLLPGSPGDVHLSLEVILNVPPAGAAASLFCSHPHHVEQDPHASQIRILLLPGQDMDRDFLLRYPVRAATESVVRCAPPSAERAGTFALTVVPPATSAVAGAGRDVVFLVDGPDHFDCDVLDFVGELIGTLGEGDRFAVVPVTEGPADHVGACAERLTPARRALQDEAVAGLAALPTLPRGELRPALRRALRLLNTGSGERILVLFTDGLTAGEDAVLRTFAQAGTGVLALVVGVGPVANAGLLRRLSGLSVGVCEFVESGLRLGEIRSRLLAGLRGPARRGAVPVHDVRLEVRGFEQTEPSETLSGPMALHPGEPVTLYGRFHGRVPTHVVVDAHALDGRVLWSQRVAVGVCEQSHLLPLWGRSHVRALEDRYVTCLPHQREALRGKIIHAALEAGVLSRFTAYVAVDRRSAARAAAARVVTQPIQQPGAVELVEEVVEGAVLARTTSRPVKFNLGHLGGEINIKLPNAAWMPVADKTNQLPMPRRVNPSKTVTLDPRDALDYAEDGCYDYTYSYDYDAGGNFPRLRASAPASADPNDTPTDTASERGQRKRRPPERTEFQLPVTPATPQPPGTGSVDQPPDDRSAEARPTPNLEWQDRVWLGGDVYYESEDFVQPSRPLPYFDTADGDTDDTPAATATTPSTADTVTTGSTTSCGGGPEDIETVVLLQLHVHIQGRVHRDVKPHNLYPEPRDADQPGWLRVLLLEHPHQRRQRVFVLRLGRSGSGEAVLARKLARWLLGCGVRIAAGLLRALVRRLQFVGKDGRERRFRGQTLNSGGGTIREVARSGPQTAEPGRAPSVRAFPLDRREGTSFPRDRPMTSRAAA